MFREYEMVKLLKDIPELNLRIGDVGVVLIVYDLINWPQAYEVDFSDFDGKELKTVTLYETDIEKVEEI